MRSLPKQGGGRGPFHLILPPWFHQKKWETKSRYLVFGKKVEQSFLSTRADLLIILIIIG